ncbi:hypothetical protein TELCIR_07350 [Teladorsagia circumcincta]|uniref:Uncharacterized protein n=1 Tax=Teladorsagia circumcincta TaxID=45464 RepID=A0A2G9UKK0_TELCI|nr:hypothetical protein TELCIR_07350 [Teladorsagia circumcincta]
MMTRLRSICEEDESAHMTMMSPIVSDKLYHNGDDTKRNGVAIAVAQSLKDYVSAVSRISDQIMAVRIDTKEGYWTVLSEYAPQAGRPVTVIHET